MSALIILCLIWDFQRAPFSWIDFSKSSTAFLYFLYYENDHTLIALFFSLIGLLLLLSAYSLLKCSYLYGYSPAHRRSLWFVSRQWLRIMSEIYLNLIWSFGLLLNQLEVVRIIRRFLLLEASTHPPYSSLTRSMTTLTISIIGVLRGWTMRETVVMASFLLEGTSDIE